MNHQFWRLIQALFVKSTLRAIVLMGFDLNPFESVTFFIKYVLYFTQRPAKAVPYLSRNYGTAKISKT
jgi:hypothetical protein